MAKHRVWTTKLVKDALEKIDDGWKLERADNPFYEGEYGLRRMGIAFAPSEDELKEYAKCLINIHHFAENYCYVKSEDGSPAIIKLRDYQRDILTDFTTKRFNILMASRQCGKALDNNSLVYTIDGPKKIGELKMGEQIFGDDGKLTNVISVIPQGIKKLYRISFDDGSYVDCCDEHIWELENEFGEQVVLELKKFMYDPKSYYVKTTKPVEYTNDIIFTDDDIKIENLYKFLYVKISKKVIILNKFLEKYDSNLLIKNHNFINLCNSLGIIIKNEDMHINSRRKITNISPIGENECTCIIVGNKSKLFLTNNYIPTHNTISSAINILHYILFNNTKNVLMTANKAETVVEVLDKIKEIYIRLPYFLQQGAKVWNQRSISLGNKSRIKITATTKTASIGHTIDYLYCDEFAYIPDNIADKFYKSVYPTISSMSNSKITITSTPNGYNLFFKLIDGALKPEGDPDKNNYNARLVYWYDVPGRFASYVRLDVRALQKHNIEKEFVIDEIKKACPNNKVTYAFNTSINRHEITIQHNPKKDGSDLEEDQVPEIQIGDLKLFQLADVTTWKKETIKDIGGEEAFNQEYDLKFVTGNKSLVDEYLMKELTDSIKKYEWKEIPELSKRLRWLYDEMEWRDDDSIIPLFRKEYNIVISVDLAEGLGQDYSVINVFKHTPKPIDKINAKKDYLKKLQDFFTLEQVALFRSKRKDIQQIAEILYVLIFEYFNQDNVKVIVEMNTYGNLLINELKHVFNDKNDFGLMPFVRYKHTVDATQQKIGIKVTGGEMGKNNLVKKYQEALELGNININHEANIYELRTFVKHTTNAGNITFKSENGNDDVIMSSIHAATAIDKIFYKEWCATYLEKAKDEWASITKKILYDIEKNNEEAMNFSGYSNTVRNAINSKINRNSYSSNNGYFNGNSYKGSFFR